MTTEQIRQVNAAIGRDAFERLMALPEEVLSAFTSSLGAFTAAGGMVSLHTDGYLGFTTQLADSGHIAWSNEGFGPYFTTTDLGPLSPMTLTVTHVIEKSTEVLVPERYVEGVLYVKENGQEGISEDLSRWLREVTEFPDYPIGFEYQLGCMMVSKNPDGTDVDHLMDTGVMDW
jgi:hypothetical protein